MKNPATRLSTVVLPQPDGPSSVISSPCLIVRWASRIAITPPKRFVTPSSVTAKLVRSADAPLMAAFDIHDLSETEKRISKRQQQRSYDDIHDRQRSHRRVCIFAHVVVHCDRERLGSLGGYKQ